MFKRLNRIMAIFDKVVTVFAIIAGCLIIGLMLLVNLDVLLRGVNHPTSWGVEISGYLLLFTAFLGAAWLLRDDGHVSVDIVFNRLSPKGQALLNFITSIIGTISCLVLTLYSCQVTLRNYQEHIYVATLLQPPSFALLIVIPIGGFLLFIQFVRRTFRHLQIWTRIRKSHGEIEITSG
jgi:C4-dicarboxylate transporter, DctQ subunit